MHPSINALHCSLSIAFPGQLQVVPSFCAMSSCHLPLGRPLDLFPLLGYHSVQCLVHLWSFILDICPAPFHFCSSVCFTISIIFVLFQSMVLCLGILNQTCSSPLLFEQFLVCVSVVYEETISGSHRSLLVRHTGLLHAITFA